MLAILITIGTWQGAATSASALRVIDIPGIQSVNIELSPNPLDSKISAGHPIPITTEPKTVTDIATMLNVYDVINIVELYGVANDPDTLYSNGYRTLAVQITMNVREINDGYQHICIFDDMTALSVLRFAEFTIYDAGIGSAWKEYIFYAELDLSKITNNDFVIRYDASGNNSDDWQYDDLKVVCGFSKESPKLDCITQLKYNEYSQANPREQLRYVTEVKNQLESLIKQLDEQ